MQLASQTWTHDIIESLSTNHKQIHYNQGQSIPLVKDPISRDETQIHPSNNYLKSKGNLSRSTIGKVYYLPC
jgi:hypothetical protein